jgi:hypothetical protein
MRGDHLFSGAGNDFTWISDGIQVFFTMETIDLLGDQNIIE